jgi:hypothetical protein
MIQRLIHRLLLRRHFWRYATFGEVAELYASRTMRILAQQMIGLFIALYLFQQGYSLLFIATFFAISFGSRMLIAFPAAKFVARFGPKHGILTANLLYIPALVFFTMVPEYGMQAIFGFAVFQAISMVLYDVSYLVDFSKVKHADHAGKEIGYMNILERLAASLAPFIGGAIASLISPEATMWFSAIFFAVAAVPLFKTREPVRLNQYLTFRKFPVKDTWRPLVAETSIGFDAFSSLGVWGLFLAVVVFSTATGDIYLLVGAFASVAVLTSFVSAYSFGRLIDHRRGGDLLKVATIANAGTHIFRAFVTTPAGVVGANIANEVATTGYSMAFMRGVFDTADRARGYRIAYICLVAVAMNCGAMLGALVLVALLLVLPNEVVALQLYYCVAGVYVLLAMTAKFRLYR